MFTPGQVALYSPNTAATVTGTVTQAFGPTITVTGTRTVTGTVAKGFGPTITVVGTKTVGGVFGAAKCGPVDLFPGPSLAAHWVASADADITGGRLRLLHAPGGAFVDTAGGLSLIGREAVIEVEQDRTNAVANGIDIQMGLYPSTGVRADIHVTAAGLISFRGTATTSITYDPGSHRWWRIRESGGTVWWDTSPEGATWTNRRSEATSGLNVSNVVLEIYADGNGSTYAYFDNLNNPPAFGFSATVVGTRTVAGTAAQLFGPAITAVGTRSVLGVAAQLFGPSITVVGTNPNDTITRQITATLTITHTKAALVDA